ncbi:hypothetical protein NCHU2750_25810 [Neorhizobium sp. NCHU2750]|nr:hypothetical protein NCHU2750_25810 [Neorhizobium sp. NCHU2750]
MTSDTKSPSLVSLLGLVKTLKRDDDGPSFSPAEKAARVSALLNRLVNYPHPPIMAHGAPMTLSAEER